MSIFIVCCFDWTQKEKQVWQQQCLSVLSELDHNMIKKRDCTKDFTDEQFINRFNYIKKAKEYFENIIKTDTDFYNVE